MPHALRSFVASLSVVALLVGSLPARAQEEEPAAAPPAAPPPSSARSPNGEYVAPLAQQTQRTYVPQSVAMSGPDHMDWKEGDPVPDGYHKSTSMRKGPIIGGAVTFGVLYLFSLLTATIAQDTASSTYSSTGQTTSSSPDGALYIPAIGPFIQMASTSSATANLFLAIDGLGQSAGVALLVWGLTSPKTILVRNDLGNAMIVPLRMGKDGYGVGLRAEF